MGASAGAELLLVPLAFYLAARVIGPPLPAWVWGLGGFVVIVLASGDHGRGFALETLAEDCRRRGVDCRQRLAAERVRRRWDETCTALGWDRTAVGPDHQRDAGPVRPLRRPELRHVEVLRDRIRLAWRPRGDQAPKGWAELVDALRRQLGAHSADWREHPHEPGTICASLGLSPLPTMLRYRDQAPRASDRRSRPETGHREHGPDPTPVGDAPVCFPIGAKAGGGEAAWCPAESPHLLVTGSTGGGKGGLIRLIVLRALELGWHASIIDPKGTGEYRWAHEYGVPLAHDLEEQVAMLRATAQEVTERCALLWQHGVDRVGVLNGHCPPYRLLVVDEGADLLMLRRVPTEKAADELRSESGSLCSVIASQGRAAGVHLLVSIQRPDVTLLGPAGGFLRDNLTGRLALGRLSVEGVDMLFGTGHRDRVVALTGQPGRALAAHLAAGEVEPYGLQAAWIAPEALRPEPVAA